MEHQCRDSVVSVRQTCQGWYRIIYPNKAMFAAWRSPKQSLASWQGTEAKPNAMGHV